MNNTLKIYVQQYLIKEANVFHLAVDRVCDAYKMAQHVYPGQKLYVAFSGGKDSVCLYGVCRKAAEKLGIDLLDMFFFEYNLTTVDPPELVWFVKKEFPFVNIKHPKRTMWQLIIDHGMPPLRHIRYCCKELKENQGSGMFCLTGVRRAESYKRSKRAAFEQLASKQEDRVMWNDNDDFRREIEHCLPKNRYICNPIIDWSDSDVWTFIHLNKLPYCKLYDEGFKRLGCIGCPMTGARIRKVEFERWPKYKEQYIRTFDKMIEELKRKNKLVIWKDGKQCFDVWTSNKPMCPFIEKDLFTEEEDNA